MKERIKQLRKSLDLTQQEFADKIGIKRNSFANYETGRNTPIDAIILSICREFNVNEVWMRKGEGEMFLLPQKNDLVEKAAKLLGQKDPVFEAFVETYAKLDSSNRKVLLNWGLEFLKNLKQISED